MLIKAQRDLCAEDLVASLPSLSNFPPALYNGDVEVKSTLRASALEDTVTVITIMLKDLFL